MPPAKKSSAAPDLGGPGAAPAPAQILTVEQVLQAQDLQEEVLEIPEWGGSVKVRAFSKRRQQELRTQATENGTLDPARFEMLLFINGVVEPSFSEDEIEALRDKSAAPIDRINNRLMGISGMTPEAVEEAEATFRP